MTEQFRADIEKAVDTLRHGGVILYPTDTVWGIGCDATNDDAIRRIYGIKRRAEAKAMITLVDGLPMLDRFTYFVPDIAAELIEEAVDPLTVVIDRPRGLSSLLLAPDGSAGFRVTSEAFSRELCRRLRHPLVSTSANSSGKPTPRFFNEIDKEIVDAVDYAVVYRRDDCVPRKSSSVIKISDDATFKILRK